MSGKLLGFFGSWNKSKRKKLLKCMRDWNRFVVMHKEMNFIYIINYQAD